MDKLSNPYAPGAGTPPPELAGRNVLREHVQIALQRTKVRGGEKSVVMVGLRGVGKTVLLERMRLDAETVGCQTVSMETSEDRSLPAMLAPQLRTCLLRLSKSERAADLGRRGLKALAGFARGLKVSYHDIEVALDADPEPGLADNGDLAGDLAMLLEQVGLAAKAAESAAILFVDEMQYLAEKDFAALISALHRCFQRQLPLTLVGGGLPQLRSLAGEAKSYAERLFDFAEIGPLNEAAAADAIVLPAQALGVIYQPQAVAEVLRRTSGYPYFLQEWGKHCWEVAQEPSITFDDVVQASGLALSALDASFFRVRFDRLAPHERTYLRAMADLGPGPHRSGDIAERMHRAGKSLGPVRSNLIKKGMIWSPAYGDTAFTVPLFDQFMRRIMPGDDWS
jgi:hypothetical protein